jgi:hypothetical protein
MGTSSTAIPEAARGIDIVIQGRISSLMPWGVTTRSQTCSAGAATVMRNSTVDGAMVSTYSTRRPM